MPITNKTYKAVELEELFFYTLYNFSAYWEIGKLSQQAADKIAPIIGRNIAGYTIRLYNSELKHILARHFFETNKNQRNVCFEDMKKFDVVVNQYSTVSIGKKASTLVFSKMLLNLSYLSEKMILVADIDHKRKILLVKTCWIKQRK